MYEVYKIEIFPDEEQQQFIKKTIGLFRYVYNWGLIQCRENYKNGITMITKSQLFKQFSEVRNNSELLKQIELHTGRCALKHLYDAYMRFFRHQAGYPKFKTKKRSSRSFQVRNDPNAFYFRGNYVKIPGLKTKIFCSNHNIPEREKYYSPSIIFDGYRYWLSLSIPYEPEIDYDLINQDEVIGIDLGFRKTMQLSNGKVYNYPNLHRLERRKRILQRNLDKRRVKRIRESKRTKTKYEDLPISKAEEKIRYQYYKVHQRMHNIRMNFVHTATTEIANMYPKRIVVEDLSITSILEIKAMRATYRNAGLSFYNITRALKYKCEQRGIEFVRAPRYFPSSQICSCCGERHKPGSREVFICPHCGYTIDRDLNAAINLSRVGT